ncbi:MAG: MBL fold metallo-hydrolase [Planctomycetota bacterium]|nr:MBL fold metallo-hydrolase [Planctomycetota bacterium]MDA1105738.1 MBL fold metallo-hydrolase [Planctomycetota bacterium]
MPRAQVNAVPLGVYETNGHVVWDPDDETHACWLVDTGEHPEPLFALARQQGLVPVAILFTHAHVDHIAGTGQAVAKYPSIPRLAHPLEHGWFGDPDRNLSAFSGMPMTVPGPTGSLVEGQELELGSTRWKVIETPGHSPGSVSLVSTNLEQPVALVGDTIFAGSVGRVDLPGSSPRDFEVTLFEKLLALPDTTVIYPGHGPASSIGKERASNPFLRSGRAAFSRSVS